MRWQPAHLSGVAPLSTTCGPPSAEAVPPPLPRTASNATATPATPPSSTAFLIFHLIPSAPAENSLPERRPPGGRGGCPPSGCDRNLLDASVALAAHPAVVHLQ